MNTYHRRGSTASLKQLKLKRRSSLSNAPPILVNNDSKDASKRSGSVSFEPDGTAEPGKSSRNLLRRSSLANGLKDIKKSEDLSASSKEGEENESKKQGTNEAESNSEKIVHMAIRIQKHFRGLHSRKNVVTVAIHNKKLREKWSTATTFKQLCQHQKTNQQRKYEVFTQMTKEFQEKLFQNKYNEDERENLLQSMNSKSREHGFHFETVLSWVNSNPHSGSMFTFFDNALSLGQFLNFVRDSKLLTNQLSLNFLVECFNAHSENVDIYKVAATRIDSFYNTYRLAERGKTITDVARCMRDLGVLEKGEAGVKRLTRVCGEIVDSEKETLDNTDQQETASDACFVSYTLDFIKKVCLNLIENNKKRKGTFVLPGDTSFGASYRERGMTYSGFLASLQKLCASCGLKTIEELMEKKIRIYMADVEATGCSGTETDSGQFLYYPEAVKIMCGLESKLKSMFAYYSTQEWVRLAHHRKTWDDVVKQNFRLSHISFMRMLFDLGIYPGILSTAESKDSPRMNQSLLFLFLESRQGSLGRLPCNCVFTNPKCLNGNLCRICKEKEDIRSWESLSKLRRKFDQVADKNGTIHPGAMEAFGDPNKEEFNDLEKFAIEYASPHLSNRHQLDRLRLRFEDCKIDRVPFQVFQEQLYEAEKVEVMAEHCQLSFPEFQIFFGVFGSKIMKLKPDLVKSLRKSYSHRSPFPAISMTKNIRLSLRLIDKQYKSLFQQNLVEKSKRRESVLVDGALPEVNKKLTQLLEYVFAIYAKRDSPILMDKIKSESFHLLIKDSRFFKLLDWDTIQSTFDQFVLEKSIKPEVETTPTQETGMDLSRYLRAMEQLLSIQTHLQEKIDAKILPNWYLDNSNNTQGISPEGFAKRKFLQKLATIYLVYKPAGRTAVPNSFRKYKVKTVLSRDESRMAPRLNKISKIAEKKRSILVSDEESSLLRQSLKSVAQGVFKQTKKKRENKSMWAAYLTLSEKHRETDGTFVTPSYNQQRRETISNMWKDAFRKSVSQIDFKKGDNENASIDKVTVAQSLKRKYRNLQSVISDSWEDSPSKLLDPHEEISKVTDRKASISTSGKGKDSSLNSRRPGVTRRADNRRTGSIAKSSDTSAKTKSSGKRRPANWARMTEKEKQLHKIDEYLAVLRQSKGANRHAERFGTFSINRCLVKQKNTRTRARGRNSISNGGRRESAIQNAMQPVARSGSFKFVNHQNSKRALIPGMSVSSSSALKEREAEIAQNQEMITTSMKHLINIWSVGGVKNLTKLCYIHDTVYGDVKKRESKYRNSSVFQSLFKQSEHVIKDKKCNSQFRKRVVKETNFLLKKADQETKKQEDRWPAKYYDTWVVQDRGIQIQEHSFTLKDNVQNRMDSQQGTRRNKKDRLKANGEFPNDNRMKIKSAEKQTKRAGSHKNVADLNDAEGKSQSIFVFYFNAAEEKRKSGNIQSSIDLLKEAYSLSKVNHLGDQFELACLVSLGRAHRDNHQPNKALEYLDRQLLLLRKGQEIHKEDEKKMRVLLEAECATLGEIGNMLQITEDYELAEFAHRDRLNLATFISANYSVHPVSIGVGRALAGISKALFYQEKFNEAIPICEQHKNFALKFKSKTLNNELTAAYGNMGEMYMALHKYDLALECFEEENNTISNTLSNISTNSYDSAFLERRKGSKMNKYRAMGNIARALSAKQEYEKALAVKTEQLALAESEGLVTNIPKSYKSIADTLYTMSHESSELSDNIAAFVKAVVLRKGISKAEQGEAEYIQDVLEQLVSLKRSQNYDSLDSKSSLKCYSILAPVVSQLARAAQLYFECWDIMNEYVDEDSKKLVGEVKSSLEDILNRFGLA